MGGELQNVPAYLQFISLFLVLNLHNHNSHSMFIRSWSPLKQQRQPGVTTKGVRGVAGVELQLLGSQSVKCMMQPHNKLNLTEHFLRARTSLFFLQQLSGVVSITNEKTGVREIKFLVQGHTS